MSEERREKASYSERGYGPIKEPPESVSEEQKKRPTVESISDALQVTGIIVLITSVIWSFTYMNEEEVNTGSIFTTWGFGLLAWFFCRAARYILVDVTGDIQKEKPNTVGRIGQVLYWLGCAVGLLSIPVSVVAWINEGQGRYDNRLGVLLVCLAIGAAAWLVGRGARYILKGD